MWLKRYRQSEALLARASLVIPGGVSGHHRFPALDDPGHYPVFAAGCRGARFLDVDGNEYVDYLCSYGAMISGHACEEIDDAVRCQLDRGDSLNHPTELAVELAERLCATIAGASWALFGKNGSDATAVALLVARSATGRSQVVCARGAYHGSHFWCNWCNPGDGRPPNAKDVLTFTWNDIEELRSLFEQHGDDIAAVMLTPFHHPIPGPAELPSPGFWPSVIETAHSHGALVILDDVRAGFRLDLRGSHYFFGFQPDLMCYSKALGNTHPIAAVMGAGYLHDAAARVFAAGTFWGAAAPMAAALANLALLERTGGIERMSQLGERLTKGLKQAGARHGIPLTVTGPPSIPTVTVQADKDFATMNAVARALVYRGSFVHPTHNWFLSAAHTEADVDETLGHVDSALATLDSNFDL